MNPLSIELYKRYKKDITREPLAFAVNNQHMNGGVAVDIWGALEPGRLLRHRRGGGHAWRHAPGRRRAERRAGVRTALRANIFARERPGAGPRRLTAPARDRGGFARSCAACATATASMPREIEREVQARMSDHAGFICSPDGVREALAQARAAQRAHSRTRASLARADQASRAAQWRQMALASEAVLTALDAYLAARRRQPRRPRHLRSRGLAGSFREVRRARSVPV